MPAFNLAHFDWFLRECVGADDVGHSGRKLFDHLKGTYELLRSWEAPEHVCIAGLFHSIYGTNVFKHQCLLPTLQNRALLQELIGKDAEFLAYVFCTSDRPRAFLEMGWDEASPELKDLLEIECANLLEQAGDKMRNEKTLRRLASHPAISPAARWALVKKIKGLKDKEEAAT
jgi:hypothetical protein